MVPLLLELGSFFCTSVHLSNFELDDEAEGLSANVLTVNDRWRAWVGGGVGEADVFDFQVVLARVIVEAFLECVGLRTSPNDTGVEGPD